MEVIDERDKADKLMKVLKEYTNADTKNRMIVFVLKKTDAVDVEGELWNKVSTGSSRCLLTLNAFITRLLKRFMFYEKCDDRVTMYIWV